VSKHTPGMEHHNIYFDGVVNDEGVTFLATRNGIIKYDGKRTALINTGGSVFDIAFDDNGELILATSIGLLKMSKTNNADNKIQNLMPANDRTPINQVLVTEQGVYGIADNAIYLYNSDSTKLIEDEHAGRFYAAYELDGHVYVNSDNKGTVEITKSKVKSDVPIFLENESVVFTAKNDITNQYLIGAENGKLYLYDNEKVEILNVQQQKLDGTEPITGTWYDQETIVIGTLNEGVFFIKIKTGEISSKLDYNTGLEDNEVLAVILDKNNGVSVLNNYSLNYISPNIPIKNYQYYEGLSGDITTAQYHEDRLYVGTNVGLYSLQKITDYQEVVSYKKRIKKVPKPVSNVKRRKGLFKSKKRKKKEEETTTEEVVVSEKQVTKKEVDSYFVYKTVDPRISNVSQIITTKDQMIVAGLSGVFGISGENVKEISEYDASYLYLSKDDSKLFVCTEDQRVLVFLNQNGEWRSVDVFTDFRAQVDHIREYQGDYWLCSPDKIYKMKISGFELDDIEEYPVKNPYYSPIYSTEDSEELSFISSSGLFRIASDSPNSITGRSQIENIIVDNKNRIWVYNENTWQPPAEYQNSFPAFNVFEDLRAISYNDNTSRFLVVTHDNMILQFNEDTNIPSSNYIPYLDDIKVMNKTVANEKIVVVQDESKFSFEITNADLSNLFDTEYRYQLKGMDDAWSDWNTENTINFAFLAPGSYELSIEAKNVLGEAYTISPVSFNVLPPYWKRPLFYAFEFGVVLCLFLLSITLKSWGYKYRLLSRMLAFLTLVIIMEYMEAIMESYFLLENSPVFSFSLQVIMAMIILPFEGLLKKYVFKENISLKTYFELKGKKDFGEKVESGDVK